MFKDANKLNFEKKERGFTLVKYLRVTIKSSLQMKLMVSKYYTHPQIYLAIHKDRNRDKARTRLESFFIYGQIV